MQLDWPQTDYIMGNPPFVGCSLQSKVQEEDILPIYVDEKGKPYKTAGKIDYVSGWYFKAAQLMQGTAIRTDFVSTNSITQEEQAAGAWKPLYSRLGIHADHSSILLAVCNRTCRSGTGMTARYAKQLGREIIVIAPVFKNIRYEKTAQQSHL